jgi:hypothetical protein
MRLFSQRKKKTRISEEICGLLLSTKAEMGEIQVGLELGRDGGVGHWPKGGAEGIS